MSPDAVITTSMELEESNCNLMCNHVINHNQLAELDSNQLR